MLELKVRHLNTCFFAHWDYSIHQVLLYMDQSFIGQPALMANEIHRLDVFQMNGGTPTKDGNIGGVSEETLKILGFFEKGAKLKKYREITKEEKSHGGAQPRESFFGVCTTLLGKGMLVGSIWKTIRSGA